MSTFGLRNEVAVVLVFQSKHIVFRLNKCIFSIYVCSSSV